MKSFLIITLLILFTNGCSTQNAFTNFNLSQEQEKSEDSIQNAKIHKEDKVTGIVTALYLNNVLHKEYNLEESFYIVLYDKHKVSSEKVKFTLNDENATSVEELDLKNKFSHLISSDSEWKRYYLVSFKPQTSNLKLKIKIAEDESDNLIFNKEY